METPIVQSPPRDFHLGDILSVTTGYMVSPTTFKAVHELIEFLVGGPIFTHGLLVVAEPCKVALLAQHPQLADVDMRGITPTNHAARLAEQVAIFGEKLPVVPLGTTDFVQHDPLGDLANTMDRPILVIVVEGEDHP